MWSPELEGRNHIRYLAIVEALIADISDGRLLPGDRLPTHRDLAWRLGLNVSTVSQAYREAGRRHLICGEVGRGTYVLAGSHEAALFALKASRAVLGEHDRSRGIDLSTHVPATDADCGDLDATLALMSGEGRLRAEALSYHPAELLQRARIASAAWMATRGLYLRPDQVVLCAGAQAGLLATLLTLCAAGDPVLVEELTFPGVKATARLLRLPLHGVEMDEQGILPEALDRAARATGAKVAVLVPTLQNPTGAVMGEGRRAAVAEVVHRHNLWVVEDDVYGALLDVPPLACLIPGRGIVISSLSKVVAPGLRFGWIAGDCAPVRGLSAEVHATAWALTPLMAELACRWIEEGVAARRLAWQRLEVAARHALTWQTLRPGDVRHAYSSPHCWVPRASGAAALALACREVGVEIVASDLFAVTRTAPQGVRISLTAARSRTELQEGLRRVVGLFKTS